MTKKHQTLTVLLLFIGWNSLAQQKTEPEQRQGALEQSMREGEETPYGWNAEISVGADFISNLIINPAVGGGNSRLGISGSADLNLQYKKGLLSWNTQLSINQGIQKNGTGLLEVTIPVDEMGGGMMGEEVMEEIITVKMPFQKNIDNIWLNSRASLQTSEFSEFYYTADLFFSSQLTPTHDGNFLSDVNQTGYPVSRFLSPGILQFSVGMEYRPNDFLSFLLTPASVKFVMVLDDRIADDVVTREDMVGNIEVLGTIHGNPYVDTGELDEDGMPILIIKNTDKQLGASFRMVYENEITESIEVKTNVGLFTNYLRDPDHIDVNVRNEINITIVEGLKFSLLSFLSYDHDIFVQITDNNSVGGVSELLGRRVSYTQQFLLKYSIAF